jgi:predicted anti-sigma-YlaC factor YlaD
MSCEEIRPLIAGYLDGELSPEDRARVEDHVAACDECARELDGQRALKEELDTMMFCEPSDAELERYWQSVYNRLERGIGWLMFTIGAAVVACYGAFCLVERTVLDPNVALVFKLGIVALGLGIVVLFVSLLRERLAVSKSDRYSSGVRR